MVRINQTRYIFILMNDKFKNKNNISVIVIKANAILSLSSLLLDLPHKSNDTFLCFISAFECIFIVPYLVIHYACLSSQTKFQNSSQYFRIALYLLCGCQYAIFLSKHLMLKGILH